VFHLKAQLAAPQDIAIAQYAAVADFSLVIGLPILQSWCRSRSRASHDLSSKFHDSGLAYRRIYWTNCFTRCSRSISLFRSHSARIDPTSRVTSSPRPLYLDLMLYTFDSASSVGEKRSTGSPYGQDDRTMDNLADSRSAHP
jgi:hypothetical protein